MTQELLPQFTTPRFALRSLAVAVVVGLLSVGLSPQILAQDPGSATVPSDVSSVASAKGEASAKEGQTKVFDIPAGKAEQSLKKFSEQSGLEVLFPTAAVRGVGTNAVKGDMTPNAALDALLSGTELVAITDAKGGLTIRREKTVELAEKNAVSRTSSDRAADQDEKKQDVVKLDTFEVFGKKTLNMDIARTQDDVQPYVIFGRNEIERSGAQGLEDFFLRTLTADTNPDSSNWNTADSGSPGINLRGLGADETVILVDGRRLAGSLPAGGDPGQPNLNGIPLSAIERIEVLPTTASGIYGGSATGGVINIVLRRDYSGFEFAMTYGNTFSTDAATRRVEMTGGLSFENGRTNVLITASWSDANSLAAQDRDFRKRALALVLKNNPSEILKGFNPPLGSTTNIVSSTGATLTLKPIYGGASLGSTITSVPVGYAGPSSDNGAGFISQAGRYNLDYASTAQITGGLRTLWWAPRQSMYSGTVRREFSDHLSAFLEASTSLINGMSLGSAEVGSFSVLAASPSNPFNQSIRVVTPLFGASSPYTSSNEMTRLAAGILVKLPMDWKTQADYTWSRSRYSSSAPTGNAIPNTARDAVRSGAINVFRDTNIFPVDFSSFVPTGRFQSPFDVTMKDFSLRAGGPLSVARLLQNISLSALVERRKENFAASIYETSATTGFLYPSRSQEVTSYYVESRFPFDLPRDGKIEFQLATRHDRYETSGPTQVVAIDAAHQPLAPVYSFENRTNSTSPTFGVRYLPSTDWSLRGSYGTGILPPSVTQLAPLNPNGSITSALTFQLQGITDPQRNGEALGDVLVLSGGNPNLRPEKSESTSFGLVYSPKAVAGLRVSIDWTRIHKRDAVISPAVFSQEDLNLLLNYHPERVTRGAPDNGFAVGPITNLNTTYLNISEATVEALDGALDYAVNTGFGKMSLTARATYNLHARQRATPDAVEIESAGSFLQPHLRGYSSLSWERNRLSATWTARYYGSFYLSQARAVLPSQGAASVGSQLYHDVFLSFRPSFKLGRLGHWEAQAGISNIFGKEPLVLARDINSAFRADPRLANFFVKLKISID